MSKETPWDMVDDHEWDMMDDHDEAYKYIIKLWSGIKTHMENQHQIILKQQAELASLKYKIKNVLGIISDVKRKYIKN